jgi:glycosyltransferase involved in cell wall biosynthesis
MPRLLVTSRSDASGGGAGRVATELADHARAHGWDVRHVVRVAGGRANVERVPSLRGDVLVRNAVGIDLAAPSLLAIAAAWRPDVLHIHDPVVAYGTLATHALARRLPTVITLHDASGLAGGCLHPRACERWQTGCGACPQLGTWPLRLPLDRTHATWQANARIARAARCAVAPSHWMAALAAAAAWRDADVRVIPNPLDLRAFTPSNERANTGPLRLVFVASDVHDRRKGLHLLLEAFRRRPALPVTLEIVGPGAPTCDDPRIVWTGPLATKAELARAYGQADLLITPSLEDNLPCIIAEAAACGTPTLAFATGGIPEMIVHDTTGWLIHHRTLDGLLDALDALPPRASLHEKGSHARDHALATWSHEATAGAYLRLWDELRATAPTATPRPA